MYAARTPCCSRLVQVSEAELQRSDRSVAVRCPGCSQLLAARVYAPVMHFDRHGTV